ncbi:MAG: alpha/beta fold hydrolase [Dehalococcoidales bacterium]|nr:alpha/beta fold hydrolase [Dehalococcoidales bacterium]
MPTKRVLFRNGDIRLVGELHLPADGSQCPGLVVCHGLASRKERHADFGSFAARHGIATLIFDARGHGESEGRLDGQSLSDVAAALQFLGEQPSVDATRLSIRGSSLGGHFALHAAAELPAIKACVAVSPAPEGILAEGLARMAAAFGTIPDPRVDLLDFQNYLRSRNLSATVGRIAPRPLLLIHCSGDEVIPSAVSSQLYAAAGEPKELWLLPGGSHTSAQHDTSVHQRTIAWLHRWLTP